MGRKVWGGEKEPRLFGCCLLRGCKISKSPANLSYPPPPRSGFARAPYYTACDAKVLRKNTARRRLDSTNWNEEGRQRKKAPRQGWESEVTAIKQAVNSTKDRDKRLRWMKKVGEAATVEAGVEVVVRLRELDAMYGNSFPRNYRFGFNIFRSSSFFFPYISLPGFYFILYCLSRFICFFYLFLLFLSVVNRRAWRGREGRR